MLRLTTLCLAGIATAFSAGGALAADMLAPPPPPPPLVHAPPPLDVGSGFYLRGDVGAGLYTHDRIDTRPALLGLRTVDSSIEGTAFVGVGAGYQFNSWLRADATIEYRMPSKHSHTDTYGTHVNPAFVGAGGGNYISGKIGGFVGLANAYVDLGTWHRITPFIGAGIGFASLSMTNTRDVNVVNGASVGGPNRTTTRMAWAVHAGLGYDLTTNLKAEVAYRYLHLGDVYSGSVTCGTPGSCPYRVKISGLNSHDVKFGLRYVFADAAVPLMPGPLMRKY
ncbi:MAG: acyloxyacyl hydrolase [Hyphomonas sp.]|jgi:opacity protein-like surface antigen|nr:acyloxyacyl hydrolase [Hyphomonas sp.]